MSNKKLFNNKIAKGLVSLITIIVLLSSMLATSIYYQNNITANVVKEISTETKSTGIIITEVNGIKELSQLNEGWYQIRNGFVFYLDTFNSYVLLYIRVKNPEHQNGLFVVDEDGNVEFYDKEQQLIQYEEKSQTQIIEAETEKSTQNQITGQVTGLEKVSGFAVIDAVGCWDSSSTPQNLEPQKTGRSYFCIKQNPNGYLEKVDYTINPQGVTTPSSTFYAKASDQTWSNTPPQIPTAQKINNFFVTVSDSSGKKIIENRFIETTKSRQELEKEFSAKGLRVSISTTTPEAAQLSPTFTVVTASVEGVELKYLKNEKGFNVAIPDDYKGKEEEYAKEWNNRATVINEYNKWLGKYKYPNTEENKRRFIEHPSASITSLNLGQGSISSALGIIETKDKEKVEKKPYTLTILADNKLEWKLEDGNKFFSDYDSSKKLEEQTLPGEVKNYVNFKKNYPGARDSGFKTPDKMTIFISGNKFVLQTTEKGGEYRGEAIKTEKIGGKEYKVTYSLADGKSTPTRIEVEGAQFNINSNVLQQLKSKVGKDEPLVPRESTLIHTKTSTKTKGKQGEVDYEETTTEIVSTYSNEGLKETTTTETTINYQGNKIALTEITRTFKYDTKIGRDIPNQIIETIYEKDPDGFIDATKFKILTTDAITGEPLKLSYYDDRDTTSELATLKRQYSFRQFFANVERVLTEFQGLGYYATLFFDEDSLLEWRDNVDRVFATLYLGTEYWSSAICGNYLDGEDEGIAYAETPQGLAQVAAHIEATRTEAIETPTGREFIYKITFNVRNGDFDKDPRAPEEMNINVILKGDRTATVFKQDQTVKRGSSFGRTGRNAIVQDSKAFFNEVCLTFDKVPFRWKVSNNEICNTIVESSGAPTTVSTTATTTTAPSGTAEGDINDF